MSPKTRSRPAAVPRRGRSRRIALLVASGGAVFVLAALAAGGLSRLALRETPVRQIEVVREIPHDPEAFTQGLLFADGALYESTGLYGKSRVGRLNLETGDVETSVSIPRALFGEGIAAWNGRLAQLTWRAGVGFLYDRKTLRRIGSFHYPGEGWGLTTDGDRLILSDGSSTLRFLDPGTFQETGRLAVADGGRPVLNLNELEYVDGALWANVWKTERIAVADLKSGKVREWIDLGALPAEARRAGAANGVAWDAEAKRLYVTGKNWPTIFEVRVKR